MYKRADPLHFATQDWGSTTAAIDSALRIGDQYDIQINLHSDTLNESGFVEDTFEAMAGRVIQAYHCEGAGYGVLPSLSRTRLTFETDAEEATHQTC